MLKKIKKFFIGKPLGNELMEGEKLNVFWGFPILASDAVSSVAYAGQEMLIVLIPVIGMFAFGQITVISAAIILLLLILMISYRQTIDQYPNGGGAYIVAKDNIGVLAGVTAGAALSVDYVMTVAVSVSSGVEQLTSAFPNLKMPLFSIFNYTFSLPIVICVVLVLAIMLGNLRGIRESSKIFGLPTYLFIFGMLTMIIGGATLLMGGYTPAPPSNEVLKHTVNNVTLLLLLRAFSSGCTALTGVEAISNSVPNFKNPSRKNAKLVLFILSMVILFIFGGISVVASFMKVVPGEQALLVAMAEVIFGKGFMYYFITVTTFIILILAANTSYSGFPNLISVVAKEGYAPRWLSLKGDRLSFDNGIVLLSVCASILIIAFSAKVSALIGLYAIGVFISFTLSQSGMFLRWCRLKGKHWHLKAFINGLGGIITFIAVFIIGYTKFNQGTWIVIIIVPLLVYAMLKVNRHYTSVKKQLKLTAEDYENEILTKHTYRNRVIVPIESVNRSSIRALRYAKTISDNVVAFCVVIDENAAAEIEQKYAKLNTEIPLKIYYSSIRKVVEPLLEYIKSEEYNLVKHDIITVILSQFNVQKNWQKILHNNTRYYIEKELMKHKHIVVATIPLQLKDDNFIMSHPDYKF